MNILLVGSGGREHALAWKIAQSPLVRRLVAAPGNPGMEKLCEIRALKADDAEGLAALGLRIDRSVAFLLHHDGRPYGERLLELVDRVLAAPQPT